MLLRKLSLFCISVFSLCFALTLSSCNGSDDEENGTNTGETVVTGGVETLYVNGAKLYGYVNVAPEMLPVIQFGYLYSTKNGISIDNYQYKVDSKGLEGDKFSAEIKNLKPETHYYYRAYVRIGGNYTYGKEKELTTKNVNTKVEFRKIDGPDAYFTCSFNTNDYLLNRDLTFGVICSDESSIEVYNSFINKGISVIGDMRGEMTYQVKIKKYYLKPSFYFTAYTDIDGTIYTDKDNAQKLSSAELKNIGVNNGYTWVDMGLSVKWATYNVGAENPDEYGDYYAWGEVQPTIEASWNKYKWGGLLDSDMKKYGFADKKTELELQDDAANKEWGGSWRMPTEKEMDELLSNCIFETPKTGDDGIVLTSIINGEQIFFPNTGYKASRYEVTDKGKKGYYWTSTLEYFYVAKCFVSSAKIKGFDRAWGLAVRAVCP